MTIDINDAKAFLVGAGFGKVIHLLDVEEIFSLTIRRMKKVGVEAIVK